MISKDDILTSLIVKQNHCLDKVIQGKNVVAKIQNKDTIVYNVNIDNKIYPISFKTLALQQILSKIGVSTAFYNKCPVFLQKDIFNYFMSLEHEKDFFFRFFGWLDVNDELKDHLIHARAVLSSGYSAIDDYVLFPKVLDVLSKTTKIEDCKFTNFEISDQVTRVIVLFQDCVLAFDNKEYSAGLSIVNSETGQSSVWIEPVILHNGFVIYNRASLQKQQVPCRIVHRGTQTFDKLDELISKSKQIAQVGLVQFIESLQEKISREQAMQYVKNIEALPSRFQLLFEDQWKNEQELSRAEVTLTILKAAQELPLFQRIQVEQQAGIVSKLFNNFESRISSILEDIASID